MGTGVELQVPQENEALLSYAKGRLRCLESLWSRFIESSELCELNRADGQPTIVSPETFRLATVAHEAYERTRGLFDPRVLGALESAGYDVSREFLVTDTGPIHAGVERSVTADVVALEVDLDPALNTVTLPSGDRWDPGGIGKGLACDLLVEELAARGASSLMVNLGGDLRVHGPAFGEPCWTVRVGHPLRGDEPFADVYLTEGAIATSSRVRRRWIHQGESQHHLIDPRTGHPAITELVSVTVVAACTWWAEVLAKAALIAGPIAGRALLEESGCSALFIAVDGTVTTQGSHFKVEVQT